jgi:hypothetical protein
MDKLTLKEKYIEPNHEPAPIGAERECMSKLRKEVIRILCDENIINKEDAIKEIHEKLQNEYPNFKQFLNYIK